MHRKFGKVICLGVEIKSVRNFRRKNELEQLASLVISRINY